VIGAARYFAPRMFAPRYWPKVGATVVIPTAPYIVEATAQPLYLLETTARAPYRVQATAQGGDVE
jgi:hypothetical protein